MSNNDWINGLFGHGNNDAREERLRNDRKIDALLPDFRSVLLRDIQSAVQKFNEAATKAGRHDINVLVREADDRIILSVRSAQYIIAVNAAGRRITRQEGPDVDDSTLTIALESDGTIGLKRVDGTWVARGEIAKELVEPMFGVLSSSE